MRAQLAVSLVMIVLLGACAKSEAPAPNKNTNWLEECSDDSDCGEALECICGICTVKCEADDACEEHGEPDAVCWHQRSVELRDQCGDAASSESICIVEPELEDECEPVFDGCATMIVTDQSVAAVAVDDERVYWLVDGTLSDDVEEMRDGELRSARHSGRDMITHADGLRHVSALELDEGYAYWVHRPGFQPTYDAISRVALAGGEPQFVYSTQTIFNLVDAFEVSGSDVYFLSVWGTTESGESLQRLYRAPVDGSLFVDPELAPLKAEEMLDAAIGEGFGLVSVGSTLYWKNADSIRTFDTSGANESALIGLPTALALSASGIDMVRHGNDLIWTWVVPGAQPEGPLNPEKLGVSRMSLEEGVIMTAEVDAQFGAFGLAADETHAYWCVIDGNEGVLLRTDHRSGETVTIAHGPELSNMKIALSDDYIFVAARGMDALPDAAGFIARFPK